MTVLGALAFFFLGFAAFPFYQWIVAKVTKK